MIEKLPYRIEYDDKKNARRNYSKISGKLDLPDLTEIQTASFEWLLKDGLREVFEEMYPIQNQSKTVKLNFISYKFDEPKFSVSECKNREANYCAPLRATMELEIMDKNTGEVIVKREEVFFGDFPLMSETGTFIINGAERVIVSQIVRSPGAYYSIERDDKNQTEIFNAEFIPSRGTWLELLSATPKTTTGRIINLKIDRKRILHATVFFKALGLAFSEDMYDGENSEVEFIKFLEAFDFEVHKDLMLESDLSRPYLNHYILLYTAIFGRYEEIVNTLFVDKLAYQNQALYSIYDNQRAEENPPLEACYTLMKAKFLDYRRYDLHKAGRYKVGKKLGVGNRAFEHKLMTNIVDSNKNTVIKKGTMIHRNERDQLISTLSQGVHSVVLPLDDNFSFPDVVVVDLKSERSVVNRILAKDVEFDDEIYVAGTVLDAGLVKQFIKNKVTEVSVFAGIMAKRVIVNKNNVKSVLKYGTNLYTLTQALVDGSDLVDNDGNVVVNLHVPMVNKYKFSYGQEIAIVNAAQDNDVELVFIGSCVQEVNVENEHGQVVKVLGVDPFVAKKTIIMSDIYAFFSYYFNLMDNIGHEDDIDMLGNRRIRTVGELIQNQFRTGLNRMERTISDRISIADNATLSPKTLTNNRPLMGAIKDFFTSSQLSQFMDQINPLAELTNKRRISALGPGGLSRDRAGYEVRDVHNSHYGRICPIETPEGPNIGLISNLTSYGRVNEYGFIQTPYRKVIDNKVTEDVVYLSADDELDYVIAPANEVVGGEIVNQQVVARYKGDNILLPRENVELADVSPMQIVSVATACIPFLENDDASRALMGANMQRQSVPLLRPHSPYVGTGIEHRIASDSGTALVSKVDGRVSYVDSKEIKIQTNDGEVTYVLDKFRRSNAGSCINQTAIVNLNDQVKKGDILADGPSMENGELALGQNVTIAFMSWNGYNYEDAIIMSERLVMDDVYTSIHIEEYDIEVRDTKLGPEEITRDIPNVSENACRHLDACGIVSVGSEVKEGDVLVGKVTPKGHVELPPEEKLLFAIFNEKTQDVRDNSLKVPHGGSGIVQSVKRFKRSEGYDLSPGVLEVVKVYIVQKRKISEGDKMAGRHGNKGVISKILPREDMPFLADGTQVDIMLNPMGVPSRMNIGQVLEIHLGMAAKKLGVKFATPVFDGIENDELAAIMEEANLSKDGKMVLYDGRSGEPFDERISVGVMYMIKLAHMVDDKLHARSTGPYSLVTQQPLGGKAQNGGQRFGEMEVWALYAYGAAHTLQELMTIKSDDVNGRTKTYAAIQKGKNIPTPGIPESFRVLIHELQALSLDIKFINDDGQEFDLMEFDKDRVQNEEDNITSPPLEIDFDNDVDDLVFDDADSDNNDDTTDIIFDDVE